jgi:energy-coupling factor transport system permease protein
MMLPLPPHSSPLTRGTSPLHRADPRLKLLVCATLAILAFAAGSWLRLTVAAALLIPLAAAARLGPAWMVRTLWPLRWLLLFTLLLHLLLSPGYTLFGVAWLSRDGLLRGLLICSQLGTAALAAALLTCTTSAERTAEACGWLLSPLARLGCPVRRWQELMALVLRFFPLLQEELRATAVAGRGGWSARVNAWEERLLPLFDRLVVRADLLARRIAAGEEDLLPAASLPPLGIRTGSDLLLLVGGAGMTALYLLAGR